MTPIVAGCDELYHLASYVGVKLAATSTSHTILNNLRSIDTILELAGRYRPKFLLTSTSEIYGKALDVLPGERGALTEDAVRVYGPTEVYRWSYAGIKAVEEFLTLAKHREEGLRAVIVRLFNVIGPRQVGRHGPVVPRFIDQALAGESITIYGDGEQRRCFTYVEDAVRAMLALMKVPVADGEVFNVGGAAPVTMRELAEIILRSTGSDAAPSFVPYAEAFEERFEDVHERIPDTSKLERLTDVRISRSLEDAIERTVAAHPLWIRNA
jgi:UDP-glucose 4-epimerase